MVNYKPSQEIIVNGFPVIVPSNATIKNLYDNAALATVADTFKDTLTNADYVVPTGFTFQAVKLIVMGANNNGDVSIYVGDTADAKSEIRETIDVTANPQAIIMEWLIDGIWAAGKYVTYDPVQANIRQIMIIGYEVVI